MTEKKANHQANIVRVTEIKTHTNADTLEIIPIGEYQVVSKKGQFKIGDLAVYIQPDSVVPVTQPFKFIWEPYMCVPQVGDAKGTEFMIPEKRRRITVRKFRGEWSEGLLLPVSDFFLKDKEGAYFYFSGEGKLIDAERDIRIHCLDLEEEQDVSDLLGITHYDPDTESTKGENTNAPKLRKKYPKSIRGWYNYFVRRIRNFFRIGPNTDGSSDNVSLGIPVYDVDALKNYPHTFKDGEDVLVTEKIHGSNARFIFLDGTMYAGSRKLWKSPSSNCVFRRALRELPWIEEWCRAHEGYVLWGEVTPTQGGYEYGSKNVQFFVFDIRKPDGTWVDDTDINKLGSNFLSSQCVPLLYKGPFNLDKVKTFVDGPSMILGAKNIREGIVIKTAVERHIHGTGRAQMKIVSNAYLEKDNK
jgi:hypothetical protein